MYNLRLFTRPTNIRCGWKMFSAWRQHEGMIIKQIFVWYYPDCKQYIDSCLSRNEGTKNILYNYQVLNAMLMKFKIGETHV